MPRITPFLWFDTQAEEAAEFYCSIFPNSKITGVSHYSDAGPLPAGTAMTVSFVLDGQELTALNGGPPFQLPGGFPLSISPAHPHQGGPSWEELTAHAGERGPGRG